MTETIREVATVADLQIGHIGKRVTVATERGSVTGDLSRIEAGLLGEIDTEGWSDSDYHALYSNMVFTLTIVTLTIGRAVVPVRLDARAELT